MSDTSDGYSAFDFSEFTEDDFKQIDTQLGLSSKGGPSITVEVEELEEPRKNIARQSPAGRKRHIESSPFQEFRRGGVLSVTDLASPAWCEVQFDYGLRQKRSKPIAHRPIFFKSAQGNTISVEQNVAEKNDKITQQGKAIHKELEREIRLEELQVDTTSHEERWALRLINLRLCFQILLLEGKIREIPVFGIIQDEVVVGIIDEIETRPQSRTRSSAEKTVQEKYSSDTPLPQASSVTKTPSLPATSPQGVEGQRGTNLPFSQNIFHLVDTKTRRSNSLPQHDDTLSSRIQLMLYHRLLVGLTSTSPPFDFMSLWERLGLRSSETLSTRFLVQAGLLSGNGTFTASCLDDLVRSWIALVQESEVHEVDTNLEIIYRLQPQTPSWKNREKMEMRKWELLSAYDGISQEERDLAMAIEASLNELCRTSTGNQETEDELLHNKDQHNSNQEVDAPNVDNRASTQGQVVQQDLSVTDNQQSASPDRSTANHLPQAQSDSARHNDDIPHKDMTIIGKKRFVYDQAFLDQHMTHILLWWHGHRKPQGVSLQHSRRCFSCEYEKGCEWREQKALEHRENQRLPRVL